MWITVQSWRDLCPHQTGLFVEADSGKRDKRAALPDCVLDSYSYWHPFLFCERVEPHSHTHTHIHLSFSTLTHRATCLKSFFEHGKGKRCHNLVFPSWYQCPVLIHPWVYWLSLPVLSNVSQLLWLWLLPKPWLAPHLSQVILHRTGETEMSVES